MCLSLVNLYLHGFTEPHVFEYDTLTSLDRWNEYFDVILAKALVVSTRATIGRIVINRVPIATNQGFKNIVIQDSARVLPEYVALTLTKLVPQMQAWATGGNFR